MTITPAKQEMIDRAASRRQSLEQVRSRLSKADAELTAYLGSLAADIISDPANDTDAAMLRLAVLGVRAEVYTHAVELLAPPAEGELTETTP